MYWSWAVGYPMLSVHSTTSEAAAAVLERPFSVCVKREMRNVLTASVALGPATLLRE